MNIEEFRNHCLSLGEVEERTPFGKFARRYDSILVFYVEGHMFCFIDIDNFTFVNVRSTPDEIEALRSTHYCVEAPLNRSMRYWIQIRLNGDISDSEIFRLTDRAFEIIKTKYAPKQTSKKQ